MAVPAFVQGVRDSALGGSGTTWTTAAFPALGAGNTVVMVVNTFTPSIPPAIDSITDNAGNVYQKLVGQVQYDSFGDDEQELWGLVKVNGGATTITVTFVGSTTGAPSLTFGEYSGVGGFNASTLQYISSSTATPSVSLTTTAPCMVWGYANNGASLSSAGSGFTLRVNDAASGTYTEDQLQSAAGAITVGWTFSATNANGSLLAAVAMSPAIPTVRAPVFSNFRRRRRTAAANSQFDVHAALISPTTPQRSGTSTQLPPLKPRRKIAAANSQFEVRNPTRVFSVPAVGAASGAGDAPAIGASGAAATGVASAFGEAFSVGASIGSGIGAASGAGTAAGFPGGNTGSASGVGAASGVADSSGATVGVASGIGGINGIGASVAAAVGSAAGSGATQATGRSVSSATGSASGVGALSGFSSSGIARGASAGVGNASAIGRTTAASTGTAAGVGSASGSGGTAGTVFGIGAASGAGAASGVGRATARSVGSSSASGTAIGISPFAAAAPGHILGVAADRGQVAVEVDLFSDKLGATSTLRLCNFGPLFSSDNPSDPYEDRLITPLSLGVSISIKDYGQSLRESPTQGNIEFVLDEAYSAKIFADDLHWVGRQFRVYEGVPTGRRFVQDLDLVFKGRVTGISHDTLRATVATGDGSVDFDVPLVSELYPDTATPSVAGKPVPEVWGNVICVEPALTDTAVIVYKVSRSSVLGPIATRVGGIAWPQSLTTSPPEGFWYFDPLTRRIFLGSDPLGGDVRCDVLASPAPIGIGELIRQIAAEKGVAIDAAALLSIDQTHEFSAGYYAKDPINMIAVLDDIFTGAACWWGLTSLEKLTGGFIGAPSISSSLTLDTTNIVSLSLLQDIPPAWRVKVEWERHWQPETQFFGLVDPVEQQRWSASGLVVTIEDPAILTREPRAIAVPTIRSVVARQADASAIASIFWNAWSVRRHVLQVGAMIDPRDVDLYDTVSVDYMNYRKNFRVISIIRSIGGGPTQLELWG